MTVASSIETAIELNEVEVRHICLEKALAYLLAQERIIVSKSASAPSLN